VPNLVKNPFTVGCGKVGEIEHFYFRKGYFLPNPNVIPDYQQNLTTASMAHVCPQDD